jgi:acyl transferase domain-containing protein
MFIYFIAAHVFACMINLHMSQKRSFNACPIAIVSAGCVLPDAIGLEQFWLRLMEAVPSVRAVSEDRWPSEYHLCSDRSDREKTYTRFAAHIEESEYERLRQKWCESDSVLYRMRVQMLECASQALAPWANGFGNRKVDFFVGCMHYEDAAQNANFENETSDIRRVLGGMTELGAEEWRRQFEQYRETKLVPYVHGDLMVLPHLIAEMQERFGFQGTGAFIDAACASSVAAVDVGVRRLVSGEADLVITGGVESFLAPTAFVSFTSMGALAPKIGLPFDKRSEGLSLGEGCVLFVMQRLDDALRDGREILAVVEGMGASSDGNAASLFSPTPAGQKRAYAKCYGDLDLNRLTFLECHGTGTVLGDSVELQSCGEFFGERQMPIGSSKSIWGHTRGAAGAIGMLKALMVLRHKTIPPSRYFKEGVSGFPAQLHVNCETETWNGKDDAIVGVSSFGFGGINYHIALGKWTAAHSAPSAQLTNSAQSAFVIGYDEVSFAEIEKITDWSEFKIPPRSRRQIDLTQIAALVTAKCAMERFRIPVKLLDKDKIVVISASQMGLNVLKRFATSVQYREMGAIFPTMPIERLNELLRLREKYPPITEDTSAGGLNNVIAGRVCNFFDFHGKSYHVDADDLSWPMAIEAAINELRDDADLVIVIGFDCSWKEGDWRGNPQYDKGCATLLVSEATACRLGMKVESVIEAGKI